MLTKSSMRREAKIRSEDKVESNFSFNHEVRGELNIMHGHPLQASNGFAMCPPFAFFVDTMTRRLMPTGTPRHGLGHAREML